MANITRFGPLDELDQAMDQLMRGFFVRPVRFDTPGTGAAAAASFRMDVSETDKSYTVKAELPGVKKEDIHVEINGNQVAVTAELKQEKEVKEGETVLRSERYYGKIHRAFALAQEVDEAQASAKYTDGVLELTLPKKAAAGARRLTIG